jgi:hypothetical protein
MGMISASAAAGIRSFLAGAAGSTASAGDTIPSCISCSISFIPACISCSLCASLCVLRVLTAIPASSASASALSTAAAGRCSAVGVGSLSARYTLASGSSSLWHDSGALGLLLGGRLQPRAHGVTRRSEHAPWHSVRREGRLVGAQQLLHGALGLQHARVHPPPGLDGLQVVSESGREGVV